MKWSQEVMDIIESRRRDLEAMLEGASDDEKNAAILGEVRKILEEVADSKAAGEGFMLWEVEDLFHAVYGTCPYLGRHGSLTHQPECKWPVNLAGSIILKRDYRIIGHGKSPSNNNPFTSIWEKR